MVKNCDIGPENAALGLRPRAAFSSPQSQFFTIRNNIYIFSPKMEAIVFIILQIFYATRAVLKIGEYPRIFPSFSWGIFAQNCACCVKDLKDNKDNSLHLGRKYAQIFVLGHYLFLVAHSFPRATLSENCSLLGTDNVRGQISEHIFAPNGGYSDYIFSRQMEAIVYIYPITV